MTLEAQMGNKSRRRGNKHNGNNQEEQRRARTWENITQGSGEVATVQAKGVSTWDKGKGV